MLDTAFLGFVYVSSTPERFTQQVFFDDWQSTPKTGSITIQRSSDGYYWNGTTWQSNAASLATTVDAANKQHSYSLTIDVSLLQQFLDVTMSINSDPLTSERFRVLVQEFSPIINPPAYAQGPNRTPLLEVS
jgi:hypothetical protein